MVRRSNPKPNLEEDDSQLTGLTLLEIIVDITILAILLGVLFLLIDPFSQFSKAKDTTRKHDLAQIKNALDTYYNDYGCYPANVPFGSEWRVGDTVYMREVPQDEDCDKDSGSCYFYQLDTSNSCPQWNILYAHQEEIQPDSCTLSALSSSCVPPGFSSNLTCNLSGNVDCSFVSSNPISLSSPDSPTSLSPTPTIASPITPTFTPTPTPIACPPSQRSYSCTGSPSRCNVVPAGTGTYCSINCNGVCP